MKTISKFLGYITKPMLLAIPTLCNQAYAVYSGGCDTLHLLVKDSIYQKYKAGNFFLTHGIYAGCKKKDVGGEDCVDFAFEQISGQLGPDVMIKFKERDGDKVAKIRIKQNYCFLEAGNITVEPVNGVFKYKKYIGSLGLLPGLVVITSIETP